MNKETIFKNLEKFKNKTAIIDENLNKKSYNQILKESKIFNKSFIRNKVVLLFCENNYETIVAYIGLVRNNSIPYLIDNKMNSLDINNICRKYKINYIYLPIEREKNFKILRKCFIFNKYTLIKNNNFFSYKIFENLGMLLSTSGSSGSPKCVRLSKKNIISNSKSIIKFLRIKKSDVAITTLNPSYSYGLSIINTHLLSGATIVLTKLTFFDKLFWKLLKKTKTITFGGVPFHYKVLQKIKFDKLNLPKLKYLTHAGGPILQETKNYMIKTCKEKKIKFISMYGATEATARMSYIPWENKNKQANCIGRAIPGGRFWIENDRKKVEENKMEVGELVYYGDNVSLGYSENYLDLKKGDENKKVLRTGDLAIKRKDNYYYLIGRRSRIIKINGYRVDLDFIENALKTNKINAKCSGKDDELKIFYDKNNNKNKIFKKISKFKNIRKNNIKLVLVKKLNQTFSRKLINQL